MLWFWADALEANLERTEPILGDHADQIIRAHRLHLFGSATGFEQRWISPFQVLGARPDGGMEPCDLQEDFLRACPSEYPFHRKYTYP